MAGTLGNNVIKQYKYMHAEKVQKCKKKFNRVLWMHFSNYGPNNEAQITKCKIIIYLGKQFVKRFQDEFYKTTLH